MNEPILSREEVTSIWRNCMKRSAQEFIDGLLESGVPKGEILPVVFADALESALLGKLCGEPVAWQIRRISGNGTMDEREILRIAVRHDIDSYLTEALTLEFVRDVLKAARRTTPDREAIIEECAKVCESVAAELLQPGDEEAVAGCVFCRDAIRSLKTAPTSDKGGA